MEMKFNFCFVVRLNDQTKQSDIGYEVNVQNLQDMTQNSSV